MPNNFDSFTPESWSQCSHPDALPFKTLHFITFLTWPKKISGSCSPVISTIGTSSLTSATACSIISGCSDSLRNQTTEPSPFLISRVLGLKDLLRFVKCNYLYTALVSFRLVFLNFIIGSIQVNFLVFAAAVILCSATRTFRCHQDICGLLHCSIINNVFYIICGDSFRFYVILFLITDSHVWESFVLIHSHKEFWSPIFEGVIFILHAIFFRSMSIINNIHTFS